VRGFASTDIEEAPHGRCERGGAAADGKRRARLVLDRIALAEGTDETRARAHGYACGYDVPVGYGRFDPPGVATPLSQMTLDEVDARQGAMRGGSHVGRYQFGRATLWRLRSRFGLSGALVFGPDLQDRLARQLMRWRGFDDPAATPQQVQEQFAAEWASIPRLNGASRYGQPVGMSGEAFHAMLAAARAMDGLCAEANA
jgi:muramidase (phage lysozyme)